MTADPLSPSCSRRSTGPRVTLRSVKEAAKRPQKPRPPRPRDPVTGRCLRTGKGTGTGTRTGLSTQERIDIDERRLIDAHSYDLSEVERINSALENRSHTIHPEQSADPERRKWAYEAVREKVRKRECREIMKLRTVGLSNAEVSDTLDLPVKVIVHRIAEGRQKNWITPDDEQRLTNMIDPLTIDGLTDLLIKGDKDTILESARGRGHFKQHQAIKNTVSQITELRVRMELADGQVPTVRPALPGEVIDVSSLALHGTPRLNESQQSSSAERQAEARDPDAISAGAAGTGSPRASADERIE